MLPGAIESVISILVTAECWLGRRTLGAAITWRQFVDIARSLAELEDTPPV